MEERPIDDTNSSIVQYLERRPHGVYRFRRWIPRSIQSVFGAREVRHTLKTRELSEAIQKAIRINYEVEERLATVMRAA